MGPAVVAVAILALVLLVAWGKVHPFLAFILVSAGAALALGMPPAEVAGAVRKGIGAALGNLAIVIVAGAMLGKLVVESGAAQRIAQGLVAMCGERRMAWAMAATGFIVGIPLFYGVGFVLLVPIIFACIGRYRLPPLVVAMPALAAMSVAHGLLPPPSSADGARGRLQGGSGENASLRARCRRAEPDHRRAVVLALSGRGSRPAAGGVSGEDARA